MEEQAASHPLRALTLLSGVLTDIFTSLPPSDPWRSVDPETFGTWRDGTDLVPLDVPELRGDIGLAALARPLSRESARLVEGTQYGWEEVVHRAREVSGPVDHLVRAISWGAWRRRVYVGEDTFPVLACYAWIRRSGLIAAGQELDDEQVHADLKRAAQIDEDF